VNSVSSITERQQYDQCMSSCLATGLGIFVSQLSSHSFPRLSYIQEIIDSRFLLEGIPASFLAVPCKLQCRREVKQYEVPKKRKYGRSSLIIIGAKT
jgi:hypothetical protein